MAVLAVCLFGAPAAHAVGFDNPDFEVQTLVEDLDFPTAVAWAPDGRLFVVEKKGVLKVLNPGATDAVEVLDISDIVGDHADRGLLGLAVDSAYASNNYVYLLYTRDTGPMQDDIAPMVAQLARYTIDGSNVVSAGTVILGTHVPTSGGCPDPSNTLDCIPSDSTTHSIGSVRSAPDGTLWVGAGDGADYGGVDMLALRSYDEQSLAGKIMHVDRNGNGLPGHPFCPSEADFTRVCTKLFAKGFRNPFRFQLRPNGAGLAIGDVGWNSREELDLVPLSPGGKSYGWPCYEGTIQTPEYKDLPECEAEYAQPAGTHLGPAYEYPHDVSNAILAGPTYTGTSYPPVYRNKLYIADYATQLIQRVTINAQDQVTAVTPFVTGWDGVDVETAPSGNLAWVNPFGGRVDEIVYAPDNPSPIAVAAADPTSGAAPLDVQFDGDDSSDPDDDPLSYDWDFGDGSPSSSAPNPSHTYSAPGNYTATLTVDDGRGGSDSDSVGIAAGNSPPSTPTIATPADESLYRDGATIDLEGSASDPQQGALPPSALSWEVILHHASHIHPLVNVSGEAETSFETLTDHDGDSYYEITLTATDAGGLTSSRTIEIRPETVSFRIESSPSGAPVSYAGTSQTAPFSNESAIGFETSVSTDQQFTQAGRTWEFDNWSDGGARVHNLTIPASALTLTATYRDVTPGSVTIVKQTEPGGAGDQFDFTGDLGAFSLTGAPAENVRTVPLPPGTYTVTEAATAGWDLTQVSCSDGSPTAGTTATIDLAPTEDVTCTFRSAERGQITVRALADPAEDPPVAFFPFTGDAPLESFVLAHGQTLRGEARPGTYNVRQDTPAGYKLAAIGCDDTDSTGSPSDREARILLGAGETVTCTFTAEREAGNSRTTASVSGLSRRRRVLTGEIEDPDGVAKLDLAIGRAGAGGRGCRWWSKKAGRLAAKPRRCANPRWMRAKLSGERWRLSLGGTLPRGHFRVVLRAVDDLGEASRLRKRL